MIRHTCSMVQHGSGNLFISLKLVPANLAKQNLCCEWTQGCVTVGSKCQIANSSHFENN